MNTKYLYIIAIAVMLVVGFFYKENEKAKAVVANSQGNLDYTVKNLKMLQTDEQGRLSLQLNGTDLQHSRKNDRYVLNEIQSTLYKEGQANAILSAQQGSLETLPDGKRLLQLSQQVKVNQLANAVRAPVSFSTTSLSADPDQKTVMTDQLVTFNSVQGSLVSQGLRGNLNTGEYAFNQVNGRINVQGAAGQPKAP